jgi:HrpA-like RNA helicase
MAGRGGRANTTNAKAGNGPVSSSSVDETMRINFTRQLLKLRDDSVKEVVFPSTLSNIERKFLHRLSEELGLKSKSHGKGDDRKITVSKKDNGEEVDSSVNADRVKTFSLHSKSFRALNTAFPNPESVVANEIRSGGSAQNGNRGVPTAASQAAEITAGYAKAQTVMKAKPGYAAIQAKRNQLPSASYKNEVNKMVNENQVVLVSGETGCGKTTQVPQFILDDPVSGPTARIVVTQPRRISAITVAERIAAERGEALGQSVGYNIRLEAEKSKDTQVLFVTPGVLLRKLQNDPTLEEFTHIIIDEAHERDRFTEFLIIMLRDICLKRASLKLVLMSATMHTNKLSSYFGGVPQVHLGGSVFPVQEFFLEDVLKFTDYMDDRPVFDTKGSTVDRMNAYVAGMNQYHCAQCTGGPFRSPEELGQHVAMCFTNASPDRRRKVIKKKAANLNELVSNLQRIISSKDGANAGSSSTVGVPTSNAPNNAKGKQLKGSKDKSKPVNFDAPEGPQNLEEEEDNGGSGDDTDISWDSDDEADGDLEGIDGGYADATVQAAADAEPEDNALIKQYQQNFDDAQVDLDLILALLRYIFKSEFAQDGSVLVFMPGWNDISLMARILRSEPDFGGDRRYKIHQLHSGIPHKDQKLVFEPLQKGEHKIILATNIAETSITIDDVAVVIDAGRMREKIYDPHVKLAYLKTEWVSQASARQRKGRAGRTRAGVCFHLFSRKRHSSLPAFQDSELLRMPLEEIVLQSKILNVAPGKDHDHDGVLNFLSKAMDPPHVLSVVNAVKLLQSINCLDSEEGITLVGRAIAKLPMDPRIGRMIVLGSIMGCGPSVLSTAAAMGYRDPFVMPTSDQQRVACNRMKLQLCRGFPSDQVGLYRAMEGFNNHWNSAGPGRAYGYCDDYFLSKSTMIYLKDMVGQLSSSVKDAGLDINRAFFSRNNGNTELLLSTISMGLYPDVGMRQKGANTFKTEKGRRAKVHPGSVNAKGRGAFANTAKADLEFVGYQDLIALSQSDMHAPGAASLAMLSTTPVSLFSLLVCCGSLNEVTSAQKEDNDEDDSPVPEDHVLVSIDGWLTIKIHKDNLALVNACRSVLTNALSHVVNNPGTAIPKDLQTQVDAIVDSLTVEQQLVTPKSDAADVQGNRLQSQQAHSQSQRNRDHKGAGAGKMNYYGSDAHKAKYKV